MYRDLVAGSAAEFSCAKGGYVGTRCGWFSDRSECFLAAGRPVVLQSTGFEDLLPTGKGLFAAKSSSRRAKRPSSSSSFLFNPLIALALKLCPQSSSLIALTFRVDTPWTVHLG